MEIGMTRKLLYVVRLYGELKKETKLIIGGILNKYSLSGVLRFTVERRKTKLTRVSCW